MNESAQHYRSLVSVDCDICGGSDFVLLFEKEGFKHVRCRSCGLVFVNPRLREHLDTQKTEGTGTMGEDRLTRSQIRRLQRELSGLEPFRKLNRILEVGAGRGWFLEQAKKIGWESWAVEINTQALKHLGTKGIDTILAQPAECLDVPEASFDVIRMWDVIEHLESPSKAISRIRSALRSGGLVRLSTTNFASLSRRVNGPQWVYLNGADHIFLFEPATVTRLLQDHGFSRIRIRTRSFNLRRKLYHPETDLPVSLHVLLPFRKLIDELIRFTMYGHQMIVTAVKTDT